MDVEVIVQMRLKTKLLHHVNFCHPLKRFKCEDINNKEYFKQVKRIIFNNMDLCGFLSKMSILNFHTKYRKELKRNCDQANPLFDAWLTITGKQRPKFHVQMFKQTNPSDTEKVMKSEKNVECICAEFIEKRK